MCKYKVVIYVLIIMFSFLNKSMSENTKKIYDHKINSISGDELNLSKFEGKIILLVNVASKCGFTKQYNDLQNLYEKYSEKGFIVLGRNLDLKEKRIFCLSPPSIKPWSLSAFPLKEKSCVFILRK